jgi:2'-5' RNA ligase
VTPGVSGEDAGALRLFVALALPEPVRGELEGWRARTLGDGEGLRMIPGADLHLTLCFLGSRPPGALPGILHACVAAGARPAPALTLGAVIWLPRAEPRVLAVAVQDPGGGLAGLQSDLAARLARPVREAERRRPFRAHITLARVRRGSRVGPRALPAPEPVAFRAERIAVVRSRLGAGGARYEVLGEARLGEARL